MRGLSLTEQQLADVVVALNGSLQGPNGSQPRTPPLVEITCNAGDDPAVTPVARLSKRQYENVLMRLFAGALMSREGYSDSPQGVLALSLAAVPDDRDYTGFRRLDKDIVDGHVNGYFSVAAQAGSLAAANQGLLNRYQGACLSTRPVTDACATNFIRSFGKRALRRPLLADEVAEYLALFKDTGATQTSEGVQAVIAVMLMSPQFLFQMETEGALVPGKSNVYQLTAWELVSRATLALEENMSSDEAITAIEQGRFNDPAYFETFVRAMMPARVTNRPIFANIEMNPVEDNFGHFYDEWLELDKRQINFAQDDIFNRFLREGRITLPWDNPPSLLADEVREMIFRNIWVENGKFTSLMTDKKFYGNRLTRYYGWGSDWRQAGFAGEDERIASLGEGYHQHRDRMGLLTRAAFLISNTHVTNPILRGTFIRRRILCDDLPSPNVDQLPDRALEAPEFQPDMTTRDRFAEKTKSDVCMSCHTLINPLGFALEDYDAVGRTRSRENIYSLNSMNQVATVGSPAVSATVGSLELSPRDGIPANGGIDLSMKLAQSTKAQVCFARHAFRYTFGRRETIGDGCMVKNMHEKLEGNGGSIREMFLNTALHPHFRLRKVGP